MNKLIYDMKRIKNWIKEWKIMKKINKIIGSEKALEISENVEDIAVHIMKVVPWVFGFLGIIALMPLLIPAALIMAAAVMILSLIIRAKLMKLVKEEFDTDVAKEYGEMAGKWLINNPKEEVHEVRTISEKGQRAIAESLMNLMKGEEKTLDERFNEYCKENDVRFNDIK